MTDQDHLKSLLISLRRGLDLITTAHWEKQDEIIALTSDCKHDLLALAATIFVSIDTKDEELPAHVITALRIAWYQGYVAGTQQGDISLWRDQLEEARKDG